MGDNLWAESSKGAGEEVEIIAMILPDMSWLKEEAKDTNLRNQASNVVQAGVATKPFHRGKSWDKEELELRVCLHSVCGPCGKEKVTKDEKSRILDIIEKDRSIE